jgi:hypothetical protein
MIERRYDRFERKKSIVRIRNTFDMGRYKEEKEAEVKIGRAKQLSKKLNATDHSGLP